MSLSVPVSQWLIVPGTGPLKCNASIINVINYTSAFPAIIKHIGASLVKIYIFIYNFNISDCTQNFIVFFIVACCKWKQNGLLFFCFVWTLSIFSYVAVCVRKWVLWVTFSALTGKKRSDLSLCSVCCDGSQCGVVFSHVNCWKLTLRSLQSTPDIQQSCSSVTTAETLERKHLLWNKLYDENCDFFFQNIVDHSIIYIYNFHQCCLFKINHSCSYLLQHKYW